MADLFVITLRPVPAGTDHLGRDAAYRLKLLLKRALRDFGLRCVEVAVEEAVELAETRKVLRNGD